MWSRARGAGWRSHGWRSYGWRGVALVAVTYVYFLIFAQFAFLSRLGELGLEASSLKAVMGAMAAGGILLSLLTPRVLSKVDGRIKLRAAFAVSGIAALLSLLVLPVMGAAAVAFLIGAGLGLLTVTLVSDLRRWTGMRHGVLKVGLGTGIGYLICNVPMVFTASAKGQAVLAALLCVLGIAMTFGAGAERVGESTGAEALPASGRIAGTTEAVALGNARGMGAGHAAFFDTTSYERDSETASIHAGEGISFARALTAFTALVWLDSAAFYIIQHVPMLKAGTWMGSAHLWINAGLHLSVAVAAGFLLERGRTSWVLAGAFAALAFACVLLMHPGLAVSASLFYPSGVSLYSVALVAYPSFLTSARKDAERGRQAGWLYAVAGWVGSAMGIGMGQNLGHVPLLFVVSAGAVVLLPAFPGLMHARGREVVVVLIAGVAAYGLWRMLPHSAREDASTAVARGRQVYIGEGCIHCHSQYVRPNSPDVLMWGPTETLAEVHAQRPPLIGNRRQGPDLSEVGARRSALWLKAHLMDPAEVSGGSIMPSYAFLFRDRRGDDLVSYLASLGVAGEQKHVAAEAAWRLPPGAVEHADVNAGKRLYERFCATCHEAEGTTRRRWGSSFRQIPTNLLRGPFQYVHSSATRDERIQEFAKITKFGIPETDMPGHEYLSDAQIASLSVWLTQ